ncbi:DUF488 family protein [Actinomadura oligospora]|uniref:DUF488 domain-containing protein n=1 Tax=Actinomadura oligospora TaxID=111804 RepID=UPI00047EE304|nr:DUF488 domain-containing protein [Actinomadura oligospora]
MLGIDQCTGLTGLGYQGHVLDSFLDRLAAEHVTTVVDVRLTPISRKRGFSKRAFAEALTSSGIEYLHAPALGNPKTNRAAFAGGPEELAAGRDRFAALLEDPTAQDWLNQIAVLAAEHKVALVCFEADQQRCHRDVVADAVQSRMVR